MTPPRNSDLVQAILEARRKAGAVILQTPTPSLRPQTVEGIPTLPPLTPPREQPPVSVTEDELSALLMRLLPGVLTGIEQARAALGDRKLSIPEAFSLATTIIGVVSAAVRDGAPLVKGQSAYTLAVLIFGVVFDRFIVPLLPAWLRPFGGVIKASAVAGLEVLYRSLIKKKVQ